LEFDDYLLVRRGFIERMKQEAYLLRHQTALICEAFVGKGEGVRFVMSSWKLDEEETKELSKDEVRELLKKKREREALKKIKNG